jgi:hypothetical protein
VPVSIPLLLIFGPAGVFELFNEVAIAELIPDVRDKVLVEYVVVVAGKLAVPVLVKKVLVVPLPYKMFVLTIPFQFETF